MVQAYSQRLTPPFSGQVQIAETSRARAMSLDGQSWEFHFRLGDSNEGPPGYQKFGGNFRRIVTLSEAEITRLAKGNIPQEEHYDERIQELAHFLSDAELPFEAIDTYEYWLLDAKDGCPIAMIFSCVHEKQKTDFPEHPEWTALPSAVMPIERTEQELHGGAPPINYQLERLIADRAGFKPRACWYRRGPCNYDAFPPALVTEDWQDETAHALCQRYVQRQSSRLLMLHGISTPDRLRWERAASAHALEVARFYAIYPEIADQELINTVRVEARLRGLNETDSPRFQQHSG